MHGRTGRTLRVAATVASAVAAGALVAPSAHATVAYKLTGELPTTSTSLVSGLAADPATAAVHVAFGGRTVTPYAGGTAGTPLAIAPAANAVVTDLAFDEADDALRPLSFTYGGGAVDDIATLGRFRAGTAAGVGAVSPYPVATAVAPWANTTWVVSDDRYAGSRDELTQLRGDAVVRRVPLPFAPTDVAADERGTAYVAGGAARVVAVVAPGADPVLVPTSAPVGRVAVDSSSGKVYATHPGRGLVSVISGKAVIAIVRVGHDPSDVAVVPGSDAAVVADRADRTVSVIGAGNVYSTAFTGVQRPSRLAVDGRTRTVYVAGDRSPLTELGGDRAAIAVLRIAEGPGVSFAGPTSDTDASRPDAPVYVVFDRDMDRVATAAAFTLTRTDAGGARVAGSLAWLSDRAAVFVPSAPLAADATYAARVGDAARDTTGAALPAPVGWAFRTGSSFVDRAGPADGADGVAVDTALYEVFGQPVALRDRAGMEAGFTLTRYDGAAVPGTFAWFGSTVLVFVPDRPLTPGAAYDAVQANGPDTTHLDAPARRRFTVADAPMVEQVSPPRGATGVAANAPVVAVFRRPVERATVVPYSGGNVQLLRGGTVPEPASLSWLGDRVAVLVPHVPLRPGTTYTARLGPGVREQLGRVLLDDVTWSFTTAPAAP